MFGTLRCLWINTNAFCVLHHWDHAFKPQESTKVNSICDQLWRVGYEESGSWFLVWVKEVSTATCIHSLNTVVSHSVYLFVTGWENVAQYLLEYLISYIKSQQELFLTNLTEENKANVFRSCREAVVRTLGRHISKIDSFSKLSKHRINNVLLISCNCSVQCLAVGCSGITWHNIVLPEYIFLLLHLYQHCSTYSTLQGSAEIQRGV